MIAGRARIVPDRPRDLPPDPSSSTAGRRALFTCAAPWRGRARPRRRRPPSAYAKNLGLPSRSWTTLPTHRGGAAGKDVGQDLKKTTFVSFSGVEGARQLAAELVHTSEEALRGFGPRAQPLRDLARYVVARKR